LNKFDIGFITNHPNKHGHYILSCSCGTVKLLGSLNWRELEYAYRNTCEKCGNKNNVQLTSKHRDIFPYLEVLKKDRKGFKLKRTNLSVFFDDDYNVLTKKNMIQILKYDIVNKDIRLYKNGKDTKLHTYFRGYKDDIVRRFFTGINDNDFIESVSTIETKPLYEFMRSNLSSSGYGYDKKIWRGLLKFIENDYTYMQILASAGFPNIKRFYERGYWNKGTINKDGKNPKEILGLPKFAVKYVRKDERIGTYEIRHIREALKKIDGNKFKEIMEIVEDESSVSKLCNVLDTIVEIYDKYNYNNVKKLILYLFREIRMTQGIDSPSTGATLLRDYVSMSTRLGKEYEKYPKSLKKEHDIVQMNYKVQENEMKKKEFAEKVESDSYRELEYKKKDFSIIAPNEMEDLVKEGNELSHCIASYINRIIDGKCKIFFLRNTKDIKTPLVSVEVINGNVRQSRGFANRRVNAKEKGFIKEWAKEKGLVESYYY
jgi:PcfJ-like protein